MQNCAVAFCQLLVDFCVSHIFTLTFRYCFKNSSKAKHHRRWLSPQSTSDQIVWLAVICGTDRSVTKRCLCQKGMMLHFHVSWRCLLENSTVYLSNKPYESLFNPVPNLCVAAIMLATKLSYAFI